MDKNTTEKFPPDPDRNPTTIYIWISWIGVFVGIACILVAGITELLETAKTTHFPTPPSLVQLGIAAFLFAIWGTLQENQHTRHKD